MKYLLLLICSISFAQTENISIKHNTIYFTEKINSDSFYISKLSDHPKIQLNSNKGFFKNAECKCPGTSSFISEEMDFDFTIKENSVEVYNIRFKNSIQVNLGGVSTSNNENSLEYYAIKNDGTLRQNNTFKNNYECLSNFFKSVFNL
jgi:hypothetical protein